MSNPNILKIGRFPAPERSWLPLKYTSRTILRIYSDEARKTISLYRAILQKKGINTVQDGIEYVSDNPRSAERKPSNGIRKRDRDRAERIKRAGSRKPSIRERAVAFAQRKGEVRTKELTDIGVHRCYLARMCEEGLLVKVGYGRYRAAAPVSSMDPQNEVLPRKGSP